MIDQNLILDGTLGPVTGAAVTVTRVSTNVIDWLTGRDMGAGSMPLGIHAFVTQAFTAAGAATLTIDVEVCDTVGGTYLQLITTPPLPVAQLIAGAPLIRIAYPLNQLLNATAGVLKAPGRFMRLGYTVATGPFTAGALFAHVAPNNDRQEYFSYPGNYTV
jgi:hypothetical protein